MFSEKTKDLNDRFSFMQKRYQELKSRKQLECQGLKTLIKTLEDKINQLENPPRKKEKTLINSVKSKQSTYKPQNYTKLSRKKLVRGVLKETIRKSLILLHKL